MLTPAQTTKHAYKEAPMHVLSAADARRIHCDQNGCRKQARKCLHNEWTVNGRKGLSFWYLCEEHFAARVAES